MPHNTDKYSEKSEKIYDESQDSSSKRQEPSSKRQDDSSKRQEDPHNKGRKSSFSPRPVAVQTVQTVQSIPGKKDSSTRTLKKIVATLNNDKLITHESLAIDKTRWKADGISERKSSITPTHIKKEINSVNQVNIVNQGSNSISIKKIVTNSIKSTNSKNSQVAKEITRCDSRDQKKTNKNPIYLTSPSNHIDKDKNYFSSYRSEDSNNFPQCPKKDSSKNIKNSIITKIKNDIKNNVNTNIKSNISSHKRTQSKDSIKSIVNSKKLFSTDNSNHNNNNNNNNLNTISNTTTNKTNTVNSKRCKSKSYDYSNCNTRPLNTTNKMNNMNNANNMNNINNINIITNYTNCAITTTNANIHNVSTDKTSQKSQKSNNTNPGIKIKQVVEHNIHTSIQVLIQIFSLI